VNGCSSKMGFEWSENNRDGYGEHARAQSHSDDMQAVYYTHRETKEESNHVDTTFPIVVTASRLYEIQHTTRYRVMAPCM
jgi:hypothetical protein